MPAPATEPSTRIGTEAITRVLVHGAGRDADSSFRSTLAAEVALPPIFPRRDPEGRLWSIGTYDPWHLPEPPA